MTLYFYIVKFEETSLDGEISVIKSLSHIILLESSGDLNASVFNLFTSETCFKVSSLVSLAEKQKAVDLNGCVE
ncbi:unnamed protein product [Pneumocystis jirovecii]|uniref:Uncharacterized protein n=1 Tax=Pneumocystis jirovecii TaxID=42068 RepID=L0PEE7_PNEJI|nr:unnamed protein product [Pneumocystis jirovecii]